MTPAGEKFHQAVSTAISESRSAQIGIARKVLGLPMSESNASKPAETAPKLVKSGGLFFSLVDEIAASERRLDESAAGLLREMQETEALARQAVEARRDQLSAARDYIARMRGTAEALSGDNGGPKVDPTPQSPPQLPNADGSVTSSSEQ